MIERFLERFRAPQWRKPNEVKTFSWSPTSTAAFARWSHHKKACVEDLPIAWLLQGVGLGEELWAHVHHWWTRYPAHFAMFWEAVKKQPRHKWSQAALRTMAKHVPSNAVEPLIASALLCESGRAWILSCEVYAPHLRSINEEQMQQWVRATSYSMQSLFDAFDTLVQLQHHLTASDKHDWVAIALQWHFEQQEQLDPTTNVGKAWGMPTAELDKWMDEDKQLPFWFDPVNRESWKKQCQQWIEKSAYVPQGSVALLATLKT